MDYIELTVELNPKDLELVEGGIYKVQLDKDEYRNIMTTVVKIMYQTLAEAIFAMHKILIFNPNTRQTSLTINKK